MTADDVVTGVRMLRAIVDRDAVDPEGLGDTGREVLRLAKVRSELRREAEVIAKAFKIKLEDL